MKKATIKDVATIAGVSTATVSHVINQTRYVSPELVEKVKQVLIETGYIEKLNNKEKKLKVGRRSQIVCIVPNLASTLYRDMVSSLKKIVCEHGYQFYCAISSENYQEEQRLLDDIIYDKKTAGIFLVPIRDSAQDYKKMIDSGIPCVCLERSVYSAEMDSVVFHDREAIFQGVSYIIESGHKNLLYLREMSKSSTREERTRGYLMALEKNHISVNDSNITDVDLSLGDEKIQERISNAIMRNMPTAVLASGNRLTFHLLKAIRNIGLQCPEEISVVGFGDETWTALMEPPLTALKRDVPGLCTIASKLLFEKINLGYSKTSEHFADVKLSIRKSTRMLDNGPFGEMAVSPDTIVLTEDEKLTLRRSKFRVAISFHYTGTAWAELHERGIRDELEKYGIEVSSVMDAHFDADLQNVQLESLMVQHPDAVIAIPTDDKLTSAKFVELSKVTKLVFLSNIPENIGKNSYVACVSVNEGENGTNTGRMLGEYFHSRKAKVGFIEHGAIFYGTRERDQAAEKIIRDKYPNIEIVSRRSFGKIENTYNVCKDIIKCHPEIQALYVSWDRPALLAIKALKELNREDVAVFTTDLDCEIAEYMEKGIVRGMSTQKPYEQGVAAALVVAKSLVSDHVPKYVGVQPCVVEPEQLRRAWKEVFHEPMQISNRKVEKIT